MMIINKELRIALLLSLCWHLFWMSSVSIVFVPRGLGVRQFSGVNFLGSILGSSAEEGLAPASGFSQLPQELNIQKTYFTKSPQAILPLEKNFPNTDDFIDLAVPVAKGPVLITSATEGDTSLAGRQPIFKPPFPQYLNWVEEELKTDAVSFKTYIEPSGLVQEVINVQASSNPEIDVLLARYVRKWRFAPGAGATGEWQIIKIPLNFQ
ncbi:MAG: hypothetical protein JW714_04420 [Candidatus Omnitrophica bacterium]|nr:hypothetical protein [Candidatus Omnitrophota bacterium]